MTTRRAKVDRGHIRFGIVAAAALLLFMNQAKQNAVRFCRVSLDPNTCFGLRFAGHFQEAAV